MFDPKIRYIQKTTNITKTREIRIVISFLFKEDCANSEIKAPSSSRTFDVILYARYSITSSGISIPSV